MIYLTLFLEFFKIGLFTFGGGYAMIPLVKETVIKYEWLSESAFYDFIGVCESTPGPIAVNMATYIGSIEGGLFGSICATLGVVLPSFIIILLIASIFKKLLKNKHVQNFLNGLKPVILALILSTGALLFIKCLGYNNLNSFTFDYESLIIIILLTIIYFFSKYVLKKKMNTILLIVLSALIGIIVCAI